MEFIIICLIGCLGLLLLIYFAFQINIKRIKEGVKNKRIKDLTDKFPDNEEICRCILKMIKNEDVIIRKNENSKDKTSVYVVLSNTIFIANINDTITRIQTMAHECIHSIQNRKMLLFNFIYTNIYNIYFILCVILSICGVFKNNNIHILILLLMGIVFYVVRSYLETDAMIKAKFLAYDFMKEYNNKNNICKKEDIDEIIEEYDRLNKYGIPTYNYVLLLKTISKTIIYSLISIVLYYFK